MLKEIKISNQWYKWGKRLFYFCCCCYFFYLSTSALLLSTSDRQGPHLTPGPWTDTVRVSGHVTAGLIGRSKSGGLDFPSRTRREGAEAWRILRTKMELRLRLDPGPGWSVGLGHLFSPTQRPVPPQTVPHRTCEKEHFSLTLYPEKQNETISND